MKLPGGHEREMRRCLEAADVVGIKKLWAHLAPAMAYCSDNEALLSIHMTRTAVGTFPLKLRAYSHRWLIDNNYPSSLPDELKPKAERMYPRIVSGVGITIISKYPQVRDEIGGAMADVVENAYADGKADPDYIKPRMYEARRIARKRLGL